MKKTLLMLSVLFVFALASCSSRPEIPKSDGGRGDNAVTTTVTTASTMVVDTSADATIDGIGTDTSGVDSTEKELSSSELGDLDSAFADVDNI